MVNINNKKIKKIYSGDNVIIRVFKGSNLLYDIYTDPEILSI